MGSPIFNTQKPEVCRFCYVYDTFMIWRHDKAELRALVFLLIYLNQNWKISIAYYFIKGISAEEKRNLLLNYISVVHFHLPNTSNKIFIFSDLSHLIKMIRNVFEKKGMMDAMDNTISRQYIKELHLLQEKEGLYIANKLRSIYLPTIEFQKCFESWIKRWHKCVAVDGEYFEGDNITFDE
ncbi:hypothetical protein ALC53_10486 [Atta colombica]|uniref:THAP domain-containing protein 9 n=1 Tax=Atta colombica TaxID=520822 RepID=A0A195B3T4_9HYME|nr:hypothetical protein ALC53_10486 [Atta colombica]